MAKDRTGKFVNINEYGLKKLDESDNNKGTEVKELKSLFEQILKKLDKSLSQNKQSK